MSASGYCNVHDFNTVYNTSDPAEFECVAVSVIKDLKVCLYPTEVDRWISGEIRRIGVWEKELNTAITSAMARYPNATLLDAGANLGMHSLVVAKSGRKVVAVEPKLSTVMRLHKSVNINQLKSRITLVKNAISNERVTLNLYNDQSNQGRSSLKFLGQQALQQDAVKTILFDDLWEVLHQERELIIKIDIEASETRALLNASKIFTSLKVHAVFMEWVHFQMTLSKASEAPSREVELIHVMVATLRRYGFQARPIDPTFRYTMSPYAALSYSDMHNWPIDIVWIRPWPGVVS